jgi:glycosyltransferase involved in cell wall biosynthesis
MFDRSIPVTVWWGIPCKSAIPLFREIHLLGYDVEFISVNPLSAQRLKLGWQVPPAEPMPLTILDANWKEAAETILARRGGLHIINGIWHDARLAFVLSRCRAEGKRFGLLMEAPSNLAHGWRRLVKQALAPIRARWLVGRVADEAAFVMSASGEAQRRFHRLGFDSTKVYQFGYFPAFPHRRIPRLPGPLKLLCVGLIEPFKGQDLLLKALPLLLQQGVSCHCTITGFGSQRDDLIRRAKALGLQDSVVFPGVVEQRELERLFATSDVLVAPGYEEPWGIRINEGLLAGLPVVVSDGVGAQEVIAGMGAGAVFRSGSAEELAAALLDIHQRIATDHDNLLARVDQAAAAIHPTRVAHYSIEIFEHALSDRTRPKPLAPWSGVEDSDARVGA